MSETAHGAPGGLRARIAAKARRRAVVTIAVSDPTEDLSRVLMLRQLTSLGAKDGLVPAAVDVVERTAGDLERAEAALAAHYAEIALVAMPPADYEAVVAGFPAAESAGGEDGGMDWRAALPQLLAESVEDPEIADADWWGEQLARPQWSHGELLGLWQAVLALNSRPAVMRSPKG